MCASVGRCVCVCAPQDYRQLSRRKISKRCISKYSNYITMRRCNTQIKLSNIHPEQAYAFDLWWTSKIPPAVRSRLCLASFCWLRNNTPRATALSQMGRIRPGCLAPCWSPLTTPRPPAREQKGRVFAKGRNRVSFGRMLLQNTSPQARKTMSAVSNQSATPKDINMGPINLAQGKPTLSPLRPYGIHCNKVAATLD